MPEIVPLRPNSAPATADLQSWVQSTASWLERWGTTISTIGGDPITPDQKQKIQQVIPYLEDRLTPSDPKSFAVAMDKLLSFAQAFGLPAKDLEGATDFYLETLTELPPDLLMKAVNKTIAEHKYHVLPKPSEIKDRVDSEMGKRRRQLWLAKRALMARTA